VYVEFPAPELVVNEQPQLAKIKKFFIKTAKLSYNNTGTWSKANRLIINGTGCSPTR